jgi:hypothetical protein
MVEFRHGDNPASRCFARIFDGNHPPRAKTALGMGCAQIQELG